jgi:hypothetical protein
LNWDLQNDGTGNPKQTKSHIFSSETPPANITGSRENALVAAYVGYKYVEFQEAPEDRWQATYEFMKSLQPEPSPYLGPDGQLTPDAVEGKRLFEGSAGCSGCHKGAYFTDMQKHDVGTRRSGTGNPDNSSTWDTAGWDTPTLIEVWRTAPYLHLGNAVTVKDVMTSENKNQTTHGNVAALSPQQIDQLAAYVMQIGPLRETSLPAPIVPDAGAPTIDAPSLPVVADAGVTPVVSDGPMAPDAGSGSTSDTSISSNPQRADGGGMDARGSMALARGCISCNVGSASSSQGGSMLLLVGLAWLVRRTRMRRR